MAFLEARLLARTAWAFAVRRFPDSPLLESLACAAIRPITDRREFGHQSLTNTSWSVSLLRCRHRPLLSALSASARRTWRTRRGRWRRWGAGPHGIGGRE